MTEPIKKPEEQERAPVCPYCGEAITDKEHGPGLCTPSKSE